MPTGHDLVNAAFALVRDHPPQWYSQQSPRNIPHLLHHADCSGGLCYLQNAVGNTAYPESNSWAMSRQAHQMGLGISLEEARFTPGAWFYIGANEGQDNVHNLGHIGQFRGDGIHTFEWRGRFAGMGEFDYRSHYRIDWCSHAPFIDYSVAVPIPPPIPPPPKKVRRPMGMIVLPSTKYSTRDATAVADPIHNRVLLEDWARLKGDHPDPDRPGEHWWAPSEEDQIPGWSIVDIAPRWGKVYSPYPTHVVVRYAWGDDNGGTYAAEVLDKDEV